MNENNDTNMITQIKQECDMNNNNSNINIDFRKRH